MKGAARNPREAQSCGISLTLGRLRFGPDGQGLEWLASDERGEVVLTGEPEVTPFMRLENMLFAPFVPEQLL
jgi:cardiolipin synthase C